MLSSAAYSSPPNPTPTQAPTAPIAIVSAMVQEMSALLALVDNVMPVPVAGRIFHVGQLHGHAVVLVLSGVGKVAAATTAAVLKLHFGVDRLVFTGVAGGLGEGLRVGDVVVATTLVQHDMDASPLFPRFEVPLTGLSHFPSDITLSAQLAHAAADVLEDPNHFGPAASALGVFGPSLHRGVIASGDRFVSSVAEARQLRRDLPDVMAVEMEGAAVAQACRDLDLPFAVVRCISDRADESAHVDFERFIEAVAAKSSADIIDRWLAREARRSASA